MKITKKIITLLMATTIGLAVVGCSTEEKAPVETGNATKVENNKDSEKAEEPKQEEIVLVDDEVVKIVATGKTTDDIFGAGIEFIVENKSDKNVMVQSRETSVDGMMEEPAFSLDITPGKKAKGTMTFMNVEDLESLVNIEGKLVVIGDDFVTEYGNYDFNIK